MRSIVVLLLVAIVGCSATTAETTDYQPIAAAVIATSDITPAPVPTPPSGICANCRGTGKLGDGRTVLDCPVCGGDGKVDGDEESAAIKELQAKLTASEAEVARLNQALDENIHANREHMKERFRLQDELEAAKKSQAACATKRVVRYVPVTNERRGLFGLRKR